MQVSILSTKELPVLLLAAAEEQGVHITTEKFIQIEPVPVSYHIPAHSVVVFTSANAVNNVPVFDETWSIYCMSGATLEAVSLKMNVEGVASNAVALAEEIIAKGDIRSVVFFCGNIRRDELPLLLQQNGISVQEIVVYKTTAIPAVTTGEYDGIFFFSPSGVKSYFTLNTIPAHTVCFAIGDTTANTLKEYTTNKIITSPDVPSAAQMVQTAISYFNNIN